MTQRTFTTLQRTNCCVVDICEKNSVTRISNLDRYAGVAERGPGHAVERGNFLRHLVEQTFDAREAVLAGDVENEFVQKFPFGTRVAFRLNRLQETLHAAFGVHETAALLDVRAS